MYHHIVARTVTCATIILVILESLSKSVNAEFTVGVSYYSNNHGSGTPDYSRDASVDTCFEDDNFWYYNIKYKLNRTLVQIWYNVCEREREFITCFFFFFFFFLLWRQRLGSESRTEEED